MDADERDICNYLKTWGKDYVSVREICRRAAGKKRFSEDPDWAKPVLEQLFERNLIERDTNGRYRLRPKPRKAGHAKWISPQIAQLLKQNGVDVDEAGAENETGDASIDQLEQD